MSPRFACEANERNLSVNWIRQRQLTRAMRSPNLWRLSKAACTIGY